MVDGEIFFFLDFNVFVGKFYIYEVSGVNMFGEGKCGFFFGFFNFNGVVMGKVEIFSGNVVLGVIVIFMFIFGYLIVFNGVDDMVFVEYNLVFFCDEFMVFVWVKLGDGNDNVGIIDFGSIIGKNWWLYIFFVFFGKGICFGIGWDVGDVIELDYVFLSEIGDEWYYVVVSYNGVFLLFYVDGELIEIVVGIIQVDSILLFLGKKVDDIGFFNGCIDEVCFFDW